MTRHDSIRHGGAVRRYHTQRLIGEQTVAAHSWGVAVILLDICHLPSHALMAAALYHDVAEHVVGDLPATAKWNNPGLKAAMDVAEAKVEAQLGIMADALSPDERKLLKLADLLELMWFCLEQRRLGNTCIQHSWDNGMRALLPLMKDPVADDGASLMLDELADLYYKTLNP